MLLLLAEDRLNSHQSARGGASQATAFLVGLIAHIGVALHYGKNRMPPGKTGQGILYAVKQCNIGHTSHRIRMGSGRLRPFALRAVGADRLKLARAQEQNCADEQ